MKLFKSTKNNRLEQLEDKLRDSFKKTPTIGLGELEKLVRNAEMQGARDGARNYPSSNVEDCDFRRLLVSKLKELTTNRRINLESKVEKLRQMLSSISIENAENDIERIYYNALKNELRSIYDTNENIIVDAFVTRDEAERAYTLFKTENNRTTEPPVPPFRVSLLIIAMMIVLEGLANAFFFKDTAKYGLSESFIFAFIISAATITLAVWIGYIFRYKNLVKLNQYKKRVICWSKPFLMLLAISLCLLLILTHHGYATFRTIFSSPELHKIALAFKETQKNLFDFNNIIWLKDPNSLSIFIMGFAFSLYSIKKGYSSLSDTYPNYWETKKRLLISQEDLQKKKGGLYSKIESLFSETIKKMRTTISEYKLRLEEYKIVQRHYLEYIAHVRTQTILEYTNLNSIWIAYTDANIAHRGTAQAPTFMHVPLEIESAIIPDEYESTFRYDELCDQYTKIEKKIDQYIANLRTQRDIEQASLDDKLASYYGKAKNRLGINQPAPYLNPEQKNSHEF